MKKIEVLVDGKVTSTTYVQHVPRGDWGFSFESGNQTITVSLTNVNLEDVNGVDVYRVEEW